MTNITQITERLTALRKDGVTKVRITYLENGKRQDGKACILVAHVQEFNIRETELYHGAFTKAGKLSKHISKLITSALSSTLTLAEVKIENLDGVS